MQSNGSDFDLIVTVTLDNIGKLAQGGLVQPLNYSYLPNVQDNLATGIPDFYDVGRQYSVPYVIFTTGVAWRNDLISDDVLNMDNPYDIYWDTAYKGQTHLLNGSRDMIAVGLLRKGYDPNESDPAILDEVKQDLLDGANAMGWKYDHVDYTELSANQWKVHNTWSGQMAYYQYYLPKGLDITAALLRVATAGQRRAEGVALARPLRDLEGRGEPRAGARDDQLHVRPDERDRRTTPTRATSRPWRRSTRRPRSRTGTCQRASRTRSSRPR